jgi:uncharacterized protein YhbP (UPF0306 family)
VYLNPHIVDVADADQETVSGSLGGILEGNALMSMASVRHSDASPIAWISTAYFAYDSNMRIYFLSEPFREHSKNLESNSSIALAIFDSHQRDPTQQKTGVQLFGASAQARGEELAVGIEVYGKRFPWFAETIREPQDLERGIIQSRVYRVTVASFKLFDEPTFGTEMWVTGTCHV